MFLESVEINNFRPFYGSHIFDFKHDDKGNINIIFGKNGVGKSTFLNSIYWCLYGQELYESTQLICNYAAMDETNSGEDIEVSVVCKFVDDDKSFSIKREVKFLKTSENKCKMLGPSFKVSDIGEGMVYGGKYESADVFIQDFIPKSLFPFLFDIESEMLFSDQYLQDLKSLIYKFTKLNIIDNVNERLYKISKFYINNVKHTDSEVGMLLKQRNEIIHALDKTKADIHKNLDDIDEIRHKQLMIKEELIKFNNDGNRLSSYLKNRDELSYQLDKLTEEIKDTENKRISLIFKLFPIAVSLSSVKSNFNNEKLENMLLKNADFKKTSFYQGYFNINYLFEELKHIPEIKNIAFYEADLKEKFSSMSDEYQLLNEKIYNIDDGPFEKLTLELKKLDELLYGLNHKRSILKATEKNLTDGLKRVEIEINKLENGISLNSHDKLKSEFCNDSLNFGKKLKEELIENSLLNFSNLINHFFLDCLEMNTKFKKINVDTRGISITNNFNQIISGSDLSSSERRLFKISLMFTINQILNFKYPILLMDPFVNMDSNKKDNLIKIILDKNFNNQILLVLNENQYDDKVKVNFLRNNAAEHMLINHGGNTEALYYG